MEQKLDDAQIQQIMNQGNQINVKQIDNISLSVDQNKNLFNINVSPPKGIQRTPLDICCVIDTSGSMQSMATVKGSDGKDEQSGLTVLDLVKHAVKTVIHNLSPQDHLSIVNYDDQAFEILALTKMDKKGQNLAFQKTESLQIGGCTNLWDGLQTGMEVMRKNGINKNQAVLLFTDGLPNVEPPRGHIPTLQKYLDSNKTNFCINTYGFGYNLDSKLLSDIANIGNGSYGFIPDSGFVGTIFVNALSNLLCNVAVKAQISVEAMNGSQIVFNKQNQVPGFTQSLKTQWGVNIPIGSICFDQVRNIPLQFDLSDHQEGKPVFYAKLSYKSMFNQQEDGFQEIEVVQENLQNDDKTVQSIETQFLRTQLINTVTEALQQEIKFDEKGQMVKDLLVQFEKSHSFQNPDNKYTLDLYQDVKGQISEAVSRQDWFQKWGVHYIPSLVCAHSLQQANNFKDVGVQHYGGQLFSDLRDASEAAFLKLPPPKPSKPVYENKGGQKVARRVNMAQYHNYAGSCFAKGSTVLMNDGSQKLVEDIKKGDIIHSGQSIECIVKTVSYKGKTHLVTLKNNLKLTPYHPVVDENGEWKFPIDISDFKLENCEAVYSFLLKERDIKGCNNAIIVNNYQAATFAHGLKNNDVIQHSYFGTENVVNDLKGMEGWEKGEIVLQAGCLVKSEETGLVVAMKQQELQQQQLQIYA